MMKSDHESNSGSSSQAPTLLAFITLIFLAGGNPVGVRFSNAELPPFWGAVFRFSWASLIFWVIVYIKRIKLPSGKHLRALMVFGLLSIGINYALLYWALVEVPASLTMVVLSLTPMFTFLLAVLQKQEAFRWQGLVGALIAVAGIAITVGANAGDSAPWLHLVALVVSTIIVGEANVFFKNIPPTDPFMMNAVTLSTGGLSLAVGSLLAGESWALPTLAATWWANVYLVLGGSVLLFYLYVYVLERWSASRTSYAFLLFPVATIVLATWIEGEVITPQFLLGTTVVLVGVWLGAMVRGKKNN